MEGGLGHQVMIEVAENFLGYVTYDRFEIIECDIYVSVLIMRMITFLEQDILLTNQIISDIEDYGPKVIGVFGLEILD